MKIKNVAVAATALTAALILTACGGGDTSGTAADPAPTISSAPGAQVSATHNEADIAFAQGMIPHHRQAVEMSQAAAGRAGGDGVRRLATAIEQAQGPEIAQLRGFLAAWGAPESGGTEHDAMGHGSGQDGMDHGGMAGMMTDDQMRRLEQANGAAFDRMFLEMMIAHHEGAVQMAQTELTDGINPDATTLARTVIDAQQAEIDEMRGLLG